jgi:hypothetical protein
MIGEIAKCENCGKRFDMKRRRHRFCEPRCRWEYWSKTHPRVVIGAGFKIVPNEPAANRKSTEGENRC